MMAAVLLSGLPVAVALVVLALALRRRAGPEVARRLWLDALLLGLVGALSVWVLGLADPPATADPTWPRVVAVAVVALLASLIGLTLLAFLRPARRQALVVVAGSLASALGHVLVVRAHLVDQWSPTGAMLLALGLSAIGWGVLALRRVVARAPEPDRSHDLGLEDSAAVRVTTGATLGVLLVSLLGLILDPAPDRGSLILVKAVLLTFWARELVGARSRRALLGALRDEASADPLTGLANRRVLASRMGALPTGQPWCLLTVDLDGFKDVNDLLGHAVGDDLLVAVGRRLVEASPPDALVSRIGGDEFAVLLRGEIAVGARVGAGIVIAVRQSAADVDGVARVEVSASVGVAAVNRRALDGGPDPATSPVTPAVIDLRDGLAPADPRPTEVDPLGALSASGAALRVAKAAGRNRVEVYDEEIARSRRRRLRVEERLRAAVDAGHITVQFQPIVDLRRGVVAGAEALARWDDPVLGRVDPGEFITVAEQTGLVVSLGERVLEEALTGATQAGLFERGLRLSWNVSPVQLRVAGFHRVVQEAVAAHGVPRELLVMEVTEQVLVEEGQAAQTLHRIAALGVTIAIDDFGTGYSALGYLHRLPVDILKIDRSLTSSLVAEPRSRAITRAVLDLGRTVGLSVVVEGVESAQVDDLVRRMGIGYGQGLHYGPAMAAADVVAMADRSHLLKPDTDRS